MGRFGSKTLVSILSSFHPQLAGINRATQKVADVGARVAKGEAPKVKDAIDLMEAERSFHANIKALQANDRMTGVLLDVKT
jgi:flagellar basal body rod protein FlgC